MSKDKSNKKEVLIPTNDAMEEMQYEDVAFPGMTKDQAYEYWKQLTKSGYGYRINVALKGDKRQEDAERAGDLSHKEKIYRLYGHPISVRRNIFQGLMANANAVLRYVLRQINTPEKMNRWMVEGGRIPEFMERPIMKMNHFQQFSALMEQGLNLPYAFDIIFSIDNKGRLGMKSVETQSGNGYTEWLLAPARIAQTIMGLKGDLAFGDPITDTKSLLTLSKGFPISVMDYFPLDRAESGDQIALARFLGKENSMPLSFTDIFKYPDGSWGCEVRNAENELTGDCIPVTHVYSRATPYDVTECEKFFQGQPQKLQLIEEFLHDTHQLTWIMHPGLYSLIDKRDSPILSQLPETQEQSLLTYFPGEEVQVSGEYRVKPMDGMSGANQYNAYLKRGEVVPDGVLFQELINIAPFEVPVGDFSYTSSLEIRVMMLSSFGIKPEERSASLMARLAPRHIPGDDYIVETNVRQAVYAGRRVLNHLNAEHNALLHEDQSPWGICPVMVV